MNNNEFLWNFREVYLEEKTLYNTDELKIVDTLHSRERKQRDNNVGRPVTDKDILKAIFKSLPQLKNDYLYDMMPENGKVWIFDPKTNLNVIIEYVVVAETGRVKITVLTVMRTPKFGNSGDTTKKVLI